MRVNLIVDGTNELVAQPTVHKSKLYEYFPVTYKNEKEKKISDSQKGRKKKRERD